MTESKSPPHRRKQHLHRMQTGSNMKVRQAAFDLHKTGVARYDFRDPYHFAVSQSWPSFTLMVLSYLLAVNLLFGWLYALQPGAIQNLRQGDLLRGFFFSLETLATVGYGEMAPASVYGHTVAAIEIICGMATTAILTGLLFVRFSKPRARVMFADKAVITQHNGAPTLMIRIANGRLTMLTHATARVTLIKLELSREGLSFRRVHDLALLRNDLPIFPLTWTLMHRIDESSPLFGWTEADLKEHQIRLFIAVDAKDTGIGASIQDIGGFRHDQIVFGKRYVEAVAIDGQGRTVADLSLLSMIE